jgi:hypothetical protein
VGDEIELVSDGDGVVLLGDAGVIDRFLTAEGLPSRDLGAHRWSVVLGAGAGAVDTGAKIAETSGRWVRLTEKSARVMRESALMKGSAPGLERAIAMDGNKTKHILEIVRTSPVGRLSNPAVLANAAALMTQLAMQQQMDEITDYLAVIDAKVDDVLRAQKDAALATMIGAELVVEDAMTVREQVGGVSEVTWSKVQGTPTTIAQTQAYAVRQLDAIAQRLERGSAVGDVAKAAQSAEVEVREWLAVLARCFQLQDAVAVLELDRVLGAAPEELDRHRAGIRIARQNRLDTIAQSTERLLDRMDQAAGAANAKVLLHPISAQTVVTSATGSRARCSSSTSGGGSPPGGSRSRPAGGWTPLSRCGTGRWMQAPRGWAPPVSSGTRLSTARARSPAG